MGLTPERGQNSKKWIIFTLFPKKKTFYPIWVECILTKLSSFYDKSQITYPMNTKDALLIQMESYL